MENEKQRVKTMSKLKINCHHGSPGSPRDFFHLKLTLPQFEFISRDRVTENFLKHDDAEIIECGYSFGCYHALVSALEHAGQVKKIILIAPFFFQEKKTGLLVKTLMSIAPTRDAILKSKASGAIDEMLTKSSFPKEVPENYRQDAKDYTEPKRLAHAMLEKDIDEKLFWATLKELEKRKIPITIIYGKKDKTSREEVQIDPLLKFKNIKTVPIEDGGHALLWTHTQKLKDLFEQEISQQSQSQEKFGYFAGTHQKNNVASFLKDHREKIPTKKILSWVDRPVLEEWLKTNDLKDLIIKPLPHRSISVQELDGLVGILTTEFKNAGIKFGDRVILFLPMSLPMYASMFALQKMGAIPTFLDSWARRDQMGVSAEVAKPTAMISAHRAFEYLKEVEGINNIPIKICAGDIPEGIKYTKRLEEMMMTKTYSEEVAVDREHTALITFTTGSSGTPKGADRSHRFLAAQHYALNRHIPYTDDDKDLPVFPIFSLNNLAAGVETIIPAIDVGQPNEKDALILYQQIKTLGVTCTTVSPSLFNHLSKFCLENNLILDLKRIVTGGAPISRDDVQKMKQVAPKAEILILYGSTEVEPMAHIEAKEMLAQQLPTDPELVEPGVNVGHLDDGLKYKFTTITKDPLTVNRASDWDKIEVPKNKVGELIVSGEHVCEKYFNNEDAFIKSKIKDHEGKIWHRTGDLGFVDQNHHLWIVGRVHNAIKRADEFYFPVRAEIIIKRFKEVKKAAFLGLPDEKLFQKTVAVFSPQRELSNDECERVKKDIRRVLEKNGFIVDHVVMVEDIAMDPRHHSKVEYEILRQQLLKNGLA